MAYPKKLTPEQYRRYKDMQKAETYPGGLDIRAGNELGFRSEGKRVIRGAGKADTFGVTNRYAKSISLVCPSDDLLAFREEA